MDELKRCPFCGGKADISKLIELRGTSVYCTRCSVSTKIYYTTEKAVDAWNRRANSG